MTATIERAEYARLQRVGKVIDTRLAEEATLQGFDWDSIERSICYEQMRRFVLTLFAPYPGDGVRDGDGEGWVEVRCIHPSGRSNRTWIRLSELRASKAERKQRLKALFVSCHRAQAEGYAIYIGVLPRHTQGTGKASNIRQAAWFWADVDFKNGEDAAFEQVAQCDPYPDMVVLSGGGLHCYWQLPKIAYFFGDTPTDGYRLTNPNQFSERLRQWQLARFPGCDPTNDLSRVLRLPGFVNEKEGRDGMVVRLCPSFYRNHAD